MEDDSSIDNELLISLVEQRPVLWDKSMDLYKNRVATQAAWKEIMIIINPNFKKMEEKCKQIYAKLIIRRWTHLRDNYNRSFKKIQDQKRSGRGAKTARPYVYSKHLRFLRKVIQPIETIVNVDKEVNTESEKQETPEINSVQINNPIPKLTPKISIDNDTNPVDEKIIQFMNSYLNNEPKKVNRHLSFFNGILPTLDQFDDDEVLEFQMEVIQLMKQIKTNRQNRLSLTPTDNKTLIN